ncbi:MAG TPA: hypothetical protein VNE61_15675 [Ktedonobacteraceae bacterium]|nr:hypothetical protein [Ktedonobacteraceae bacterium]
MRGFVKSRLRSVAADHAVAPIGAQDMHPQLELRDGDKALLFGEERVLFIGMDGLVRRR